MYSHKEDNRTKTTSLTSFMLYLPFNISLAGNNRVSLEVGSFFALSSLETSKEKNPRKPPTNDNTIHEHNINGKKKGSKIVISNAKLTRSVMHRRSGDQFRLDLFEMQDVDQRNWFDLTNLNEAYTPPKAHPSGDAFWTQSITYAGASRYKFLYDIVNHVDTNGTSSVGFIAPSPGPGFMKDIQTLTQTVGIQAAGDTIGEIIIKSKNSDVSLFGPEMPSPGTTVSGFVCLMSGDFLPAEANQFNYSAFLELAAASYDDVAEFLDDYVLSNHHARSAVAKKNRKFMPGDDVPTEVLFFDGLGGTDIEALIQ